MKKTEQIIDHFHLNKLSPLIGYWYSWKHFRAIQYSLDRQKELNLSIVKTIRERYNYFFSDLEEALRSMIIIEAYKLIENKKNTWNLFQLHKQLGEPFDLFKNFDKNTITKIKIFRHSIIAHDAKNKTVNQSISFEEMEIFMLKVETILNQLSKKYSDPRSWYYYDHVEKNLKPEIEDMFMKLEVGLSSKNQ